MNKKQQRRVQDAALKGLKYTSFYILMMLLISLVGQKWAGGGLRNIITIGIIFGTLLGLWELYYKKSLYLKLEQLPMVITELEQLGFKQNQNFKKTKGLHFIRKAYEKLGFTEDIYLFKTEEWIEIKGIQKYIRHFGAKFGG